MKTLVCSIVIAIQVLLFRSYYSTDFEVHRNWLSLTNILPRYLWYFEATSEWTLDYPPLFAWMEYGIGKIAKYWMPEIVFLTHLNIPKMTVEMVEFHRMSVVVLDMVLLLALMYYMKKDTLESKKWTVLAVGGLDAGLMMVDHMHFQYNGLLLGILILSMACIRNGNDVGGATLFAVLLMLKHIYLYAALLYFVYLLRHYCTMEDRFLITRFLTLALVVISVLVVSLVCILPLNDGHVSKMINFGVQCASVASCQWTTLLQLVSRLFPIQRGLCHAYWAPNVWALYAAFDKVVYQVLRRLPPYHWIPDTLSSGSMSLGLVQVAQFSVLPNIAPITTAILTLLFMMPVLIKVWKCPHPEIFTIALVYCMHTAFMLGYHVHEKAVLQALLPMALLSCDSAYDARLYLLLASTGYVSLHPLFFTPTEMCTRVWLTLGHLIIAYRLIHDQVSISLKQRRIAAMNSKFNASKCLQLYILGLAVIVPVTSILRLYCLAWPFLPQLFTSVYCAIGMFISWLLLYRQVCRKFISLNPNPIETRCETHRFAW